MCGYVEVYMDESGDLGFSLSSSRHFVVVALASPEPKELSRVLRRTRRRLYSSDKMTPEFKFKSSPEHVRKLILRDVAGTSTRVAWSGIAKHSALAELGEDKDELYLHSCSSALAELMSRTHAKRVHIVLDKRSSGRSLRRHFEEHLLGVVRSNHRGYFAPSTSVSHMDSVNSAGVQVADIVAGAVFRSLERSDNSYLNLITGNIVYGGLHR